MAGILYLVRHPFNCLRPFPPAPHTVEMPRISAFFGIVISMNWDDHLPPHFHAKYAEFTASITIRSLAKSKSRFPKRQLALVRQWAELHEEELMVNWERARQKLPLNPIEPLVKN